MIKKTTAQIVQQAKQVARDESGEFLRTTKRQVGLEKELPQKEKEPQETVLERKAEEDTKRSQRLNQALEAELKDIRKEREEKEKAWKTEQGGKMTDKTKEEIKPLIEPKSKPKRGLFAGMKTRIKRLERSSETRLPPSG